MQKNASFYSGFYCFSLVALGHGITHNMVHGVTFLSHSRYSANHNALDIWPIRAHLTSQKDELSKNRRVSERQSIEEQQ